MYFSQQGEDKFLYENYLNYNNGFFIELGAMDGISYSNTLFFEKKLNWNGILIEPTSQYNQLIRNRPKCHNFNYAVSINEGEVEFIGDDALGGIKETMSDWHLKGWKLEEKFKPTKVQGRPMSKILDGLKIDMVDFFSIDVEGGELEVLKTFNWSIPVYLILIEGNYTATEDEKTSWIKIPNSNGLTVNKNYIERIDECTKIMKDNNFDFKCKIGNNEVWINEKNKRK